MAEQFSRFPEIWNDDSRMSVLFAPFREKSLNPSSWEQKMSFWSNLIVADCKACGDVIIDLKTLPCRFQRNGKVPACINTVVDEMSRKNKLKSLDKIAVSPSKHSPANKGWMSWGLDTFIKAPISFGWNFMTKPNVPCTQLVVVDVLKEKTDQICEKHFASVDCDITDSVIEYSELLNKCSQICKTEEEFNIVLTEIVNQKRAVVHHTDNCVLIKFAQRSETTARRVTDQDIQIYSLKKASTVLLERIEKLGKETDRLTVEAKMYKRKDMKHYALRSLRQRRRTQERMKKLSGSVDLIDDVLSRIQHAASDEMILKALQAGSGALKTLTSKTGIEEVHTTMDNLAEILDQQNEIESELSMNTSKLSDISSDDLEKELDSLIGDPSNGIKEGSPRGDLEKKSSPDSADSISDIADLLADLDFGAPSTPEQGHVIVSPSPSNTSCDVFDMKFPEVPKFSPGTPEKSKDRKKTSASPRMEEAPL